MGRGSRAEQPKPFLLEGKNWNLIAITIVLYNANTPVSFAKWQLSEWTVVSIAL